MKIGRNETCPCESGLKYKKCCLNKSRAEKVAQALSESLISISKDKIVKQCLHPNQHECDSRIIKAHAIQNNRILNKIARNGYVVTINGSYDTIFQVAEEKGRKIATTFTGFCGYHDKVMFQEVEDLDFFGSQKQCFLLTYRTMAWHYHKKQEELNAIVIISERMKKRGFDLSSSELGNPYEQALKLGVIDNNKEKSTFDRYLLSESFDQVSYSIWKIPFEIKFALSMMHELEYDIHGNRINNLLTNVDLKKIYLNIFPSKNESFCVWSWLKQNDDVYKDFSEQFMELSTLSKENYLNNYLPRWSDSIILSPNLWDYWGSEIQQSFITHANFGALYLLMEEETSDFKYEYADTPWNLFEIL